MRDKGCRVELICTVLTSYGFKIAPRSYRAAKTRPISARAKSDANITALMTAWRDTPDDKGRLPRERFYGCRKMRALLARHGID
jgi:putative transposase